MALILCPECAKEISDRANSCPNCGSPIDRSLNQEVDATNIHAASNPPTVDDKVVTYRTNKAGLIYRIATGNLVPSSWILDWISFYETYFELKTRNGKHYKFDYADCKTSDSLFGRIETVTLSIKSISTRKKVKLHIMYPKELQKHEVKDIEKRLKTGKRLF